MQARFRSHREWWQVSRVWNVTFSFAEAILRAKSLAVCPAAYRAVESREKDALFQDPMAEGLAGEQAIQQVTMLLTIDGIETVLGGCASASRQHSECSDLCIFLC